MTQNSEKDKKYVLNNTKDFIELCSKFIHEHSGITVVICIAFLLCLPGSLFLLFLIFIGLILLDGLNSF